MLLIGAGGHARQLVEILAGQGATLNAYCDRRNADWLACAQIADDAVALVMTPRYAAALGLGGVTADALHRRLDLFDAFVAAGWAFPPLLHSASVRSPSAQIDAGAQALAAAVIQPAARIEAAAIVNTGAVVEHDVVVGRGAHIAPGAVVLGGARVGVCAMIGAGAVVLPGTIVPDGALVPANQVFHA